MPARRPTRANRTWKAFGVMGRRARTRTHAAMPLIPAVSAVGLEFRRLVRDSILRPANVEAARGERSAQGWAQARRLSQTVEPSTPEVHRAGESAIGGHLRPDRHLSANMLRA